MEKKTIMIVEDNQINRKILKKILSEDYLTIEAENGLVALEQLNKNACEIAAIILDLKMPKMNGFEFLDALLTNEKYVNTPVIIASASTDNISEAEGLKHGAWDFVTKPYDAEIIKFRLLNAIERSKLHLFEELKHHAEHDDLTGLFNQRKFYDETRIMLNENPDKSFVLLRFDVDNFKNFNAYYGSKTGDKILIDMSKMIAETFSNRLAKYGRIGSDVFGVCVEYSSKELINEAILYAQKRFKEYDGIYDLSVPFGVYYIEDRALNINQMFDYATMAAKSCKGQYLNNVAVYTESMSEKLKFEQDITKEMVKALEEGQFCIFFQPKYNIITNQPFGAEALIRWRHPYKGLIPPGKFIPVFEKNGFIVRIDYFVWETVCQYLRKWIDSGFKPLPVSVNVSRTNLTNLKVVNQISELVKKYRIDPSLLQLEITESSYMENPEMLNQIVQGFHKNGFTVLMDDFGSGYSSLNTLKDIAVDILKVDMKFLPTGDDNPKSEKILASVIRMADWLGMPTIVEGVETENQNNYLKSVGCVYVQGYFYGRPMPLENFMEILEAVKAGKGEKENISKSNPQLDALLSSDPKTEAILSGLSVPVAIYEYNDRRFDRIRINQAYLDVFGHQLTDGFKSAFIDNSEYQKICDSIEIVAKTHFSTETDIKYNNVDGSFSWYRLNIRFIMSSNNHIIVCAVYTEITQAKQIENELSKISHMINQMNYDKRSMLVIDDSEISRQLVRTMFEKEFNIIEAVDGIDGLKKLKAQYQDISVVLLDMIMPEMSGEVFLTMKNQECELRNIPVVIISTDSTVDLQVDMLKIGVNDYITKPFVPEVAIKRVHNVLEYQNKFLQLINEYKKSSR